MELSFPRIMFLLRRWWWLLMLGFIIGAGVGYAVSNRNETTYTASVLLQVNGSDAEDAWDPDFIDASGVIALSYRQVVWNAEVMTPVLENLDLPYDLEDLRENVFAWTINGTRMLEISVEDTNPTRAAAIANEVAHSLVQYAESESQAVKEPARQAVDEQINSVSEEIDQLNVQIAELEPVLEEDDAAGQRLLDQLILTRDEFSKTYFELINTRRDMDLAAASAVAPLSIATPAEPLSDTESAPIVATGFGAVFGLVVGTIGILTLGYLDKTIGIMTDFDALAGVPVLGMVGREPGSRRDDNPIFVSASPYASASEAVRRLRSRLVFDFVGHTKRQLAITSPLPDVGKSKLVANLAMAAAQSGMKTVLIDADVMHPRQHTLFGVSNERGLSTWLSSRDSKTGPNASWSDFAFGTRSPNLVVIPSGPGLEMPADVLIAAGRLRSLLRSIGDDADLVVIDSPPCLSANDSVSIAADVEGTILVCRPQKTTRDQVRESVRLLQHTGTPIVGVVLNAVSGHRKADQTITVPDVKTSAHRSRAFPATGHIVAEETANGAD